MDTNFAGWRALVESSDQTPPLCPGTRMIHSLSLFFLFDLGAVYVWHLRRLKVTVVQPDCLTAPHTVH